MLRISDVADVIDRLQADQVSPAAQHVWEWFWDLKAGSQSGFTETLTWADIAEWSQLCNITLKVWEARALVRMGLAFSSARRKKE